MRTLATMLQYTGYATSPEDVITAYLGSVASRYDTKGMVAAFVTGINDSINPAGIALDCKEGVWGFRSNSPVPSNARELVGEAFDGVELAMIADEYKLDDSAGE